MSYIEINGANIYYNADGTTNRGRLPIVLIHGSTNDSHTDWDLIIPAMAKGYPCIRCLTSADMESPTIHT